jgi:hypothetical protein
MWRIFYADGTQFSSKDGPWKDAPVYGVIVVSEQYGAGPKRVIHGHQYYWLDADGRVQNAPFTLVPMPRPVCKLGDSIKESMYAYWVKLAEETPV